MYQMKPREQKLQNQKRKGKSVQCGGAKRLLLLSQIEAKRYERIKQ